jgi:ATP-binding cassette subfamily B protein
MVLQDTWLFAGSIRDNIAYGKPDATEEEIIAAAKAADAHSFIRRLPNGYNTLITDASENLSQGQKDIMKNFITASLLLYKAAKSGQTLK